MKYLSACHGVELKETSLFNGREKFGTGWYCPTCKEIIYFRGKFLFQGWEVREGAQGFGGYYKGKGIKKAKKMAPRSNTAQIEPYKKVVASHGLERKEIMAANAYQPED